MKITLCIRSTVWFVTGATAAMSGTLLFTSAWRADAAPGDVDSTFDPVVPCRLFDTRPAPDNVGSRNTPLGAGEAHTQQVRGSNGNCTIPDDAVAVAMNVTIVNPSAPSYLSVYPTGSDRPISSNLNYLAGSAPTPNKVDVKLSVAGETDFFNAFGTVDVVADVVGFYTKASLLEFAAHLESPRVSGFHVLTAQESLNPTTASRLSTPECRAGEHAVSGGVDTNNEFPPGPMKIDGLFPNSANGFRNWYVDVVNTGPNAQEVTLFTTCSATTTG